jgi:broad specificity phosphatase PhoE
MPEVVLVRHAATAWTGTRYCGSSDPPLSDPGREAATRLGADLAPTLRAGTRILSSPLHRARETALIIAAAAGIVSVDLDARWREADFGTMEGRTFDEVLAIDPVLAGRLLDADTALDWPGGEMAADFRARIEQAWRDAVGVVPVLVVSHAGPIRIAKELGGASWASGGVLPDAGSVVRIPVGPPA